MIRLLSSPVHHERTLTLDDTCHEETYVYIHSSTLHVPDLLESLQNSSDPRQFGP